jgi:hypothetical protein
MRHVHALCLGLTAASLVSTSALACADSRNLTSIFFASVPAHIASPVVAQVRVMKLLNPILGGASYAGHAQVAKVIRGAIKGSEIKLVTRPKSICDMPFRTGDRGIVVGTIRYDAGDLPEFEALAESLNERIRREGTGKP